jgi:Fe-S-cluster containining protein
MDAMDSCKRCGTCCRKGGPSLHAQDHALMEKGLLTHSDLVTLRKGELAFDPIQDQVLPLGNELIKIKGQGKSWVCRFLEPTHSCRIYDCRPVECQALLCWNTEQLEAVYNKDRLTRADLFTPESGLPAIIEEHEAKCPYSKVLELAEQSVAGKGNAVKELAALAEYDRSLRALLVQKAGAMVSELDLILGRDVLATLPALGLTLVRKDSKTYQVIRSKKQGMGPGRALWKP